MRAAPDGHTILMHLTGYIQNVSLYRKVPYDPFKDLSPVTQLGTQAMGLAVSQSSRFTSFSALADAMKMTPSEFSYGSFGVGSTGHIFGELLKSNLEVSIPHIPYRGESLMLPDLLAGRVSLGFVSAAAAVNRQRDGTLRILAISGPKRHPQLPQVPTLDEVGMKGFNVVGWYGLFVPKDTAAHTVAKIAEDTRKALSTPDIADRMKDLSIEPTGTSPAEFAKLLRTDYSRWDDLIKKFQIVAE